MEKQTDRLIGRRMDRWIKRQTVRYTKDGQMDGEAGGQLVR
jgi:hypothetical protein